MENIEKKETSISGTLKFFAIIVVVVTILIVIKMIIG